MSLLEYTTVHHIVKKSFQFNFDFRIFRLLQVIMMHR